MRAAKFDPRRASNSHSSLSNGGEAGSRRPASDDAAGLPNGVRISHGLWQPPPPPHQRPDDKAGLPDGARISHGLRQPLPPQPQRPVVQVQGAPTYQRAPSEPPRWAPNNFYRSTSWPEERRVEAAQPEPARLEPRPRLPRPEPVQPELARREPVQPEIARPQIARPEPAQSEPVLQYRSTALPPQPSGPHPEPRPVPRFTPTEPRAAPPPQFSRQPQSTLRVTAPTLPEAAPQHRPAAPLPAPEPAPRPGSIGPLERAVRHFIRPHSEAARPIATAPQPSPAPPTYVPGRSPEPPPGFAPPPPPPQTEPPPPRFTPPPPPPQTEPPPPRLALVPEPDPVRRFDLLSQPQLPPVSPRIGPAQQPDATPSRFSPLTQAGPVEPVPEPAPRYRPTSPRDATRRLGPPRPDRAPLPAAHFRSGLPPQVNSGLGSVGPTPAPNPSPVANLKAFAVAPASTREAPAASGALASWGGGVTTAAPAAPRRAGPRYGPPAHAGAGIEVRRVQAADLAAIPVLVNADLLPGQPHS